MNTLLRNLSFAVLLSVTFVLIIGCGVSEKTIESTKARIDSLEAKGVPDSLLSEARTYVAQVESKKRHGDRPGAAKIGKKMLDEVERLEKSYTEKMEELEPWIEKKKSEFNKDKEELKGPQLKKFDSLMAVADSFETMNWLYQVEAMYEGLDTIVPKLKEDQKIASELRPKAVGRWSSTQKAYHSEIPEVDAVTKKKFILKSNGDGQYIEEKKGQQSQFLKVDWKYISWGEWGMKGDTVVLYVDRFKAPKQKFWNYSQEKKKWILEDHGLYDSTITDGSQDRFIYWEDLKNDFKRY